MSLKPVLIFVIALMCATPVLAQPSIQEYYHRDKSFDDSLQNIIRDVGLDGSFDAGEDGAETVSFAVIDLNGDAPVLGGVHYANFIYPASVYKMYVAMEILRQVLEGYYSLYQTYTVQSPNDVDASKEISFDPRPLLEDGDEVTVYYLLDLMITRSDNSAANCLIDIATRDSINQTMHRNNWEGSEVTRKFLDRKYEDPGYETIRGTETSALHAVDFMYKIYHNRLVNPWVSMQMKTLLGAQLDTTKLSAGLPSDAMFYHKTGWWSIYTHDVGIVDDGQIRYIIALFTPVKEEEVRPKFEEVSRRVYRLIKNRNGY